MDTYSYLREFADSWFLIAMFGFFIGTVVFATWPSLRTAREAAANIPLQDDRPKCANACDACTCHIDNKKELGHE